jgi:glutamine synthetase
MTEDDGSLSKYAKMVIGGLTQYAESLTAFGNTTSSAYLRLVPNQEAPTRVCWSDLNRSAMIRVPLGWNKTMNLNKTINPQQPDFSDELEKLQTVELRTPDGSAITHLMLAGITMAAEWGLTHEKEALERTQKAYVTGNIFKDKALLESLPALPASCMASARLIREKRALYERDGIFPESIIDYVANLLEQERDENMNQYLADLPADDRLHKTRKIMHKDLHRH